MSKRTYGEGRVYPRGRRFWIEYYVGGKPEREPAGKTEQEAAALLAERNAALGRGEPVSAKAARMRVRDVMRLWHDERVRAVRARVTENAKNNPTIDVERDVYRKTAHARLHRKWIEAHLGHFMIAELRPDVHIVGERGYHTKRREEGIADGTIRVECGSLIAAINLAHRWHLVSHVPHIPIPARGAPRDRYPDPVTLDKILAHVHPAAARDALEFCAVIARRINEVVGLIWPWVHLRDNEIRIPTSKNRKPIVIPIIGEMGTILHRRFAERNLGCPFVFWHDTRAGRGAGKPRPFHQDTLRDKFKAACDAEGVRYLPHDLRRAGVRMLRRGGVDEATAMLISNHKDVRIFREHYDSISTDEKRAALLKADAYRARLRRGE